MKLVRILPFLFLLSDACIDRFDLPEGIRESPKLVVDGMITDQPGPATIRLFQSRGVNEDLDKLLPVVHAVVSILDDAGNSETLHETSPGVYQTSGIDIQGQIGRKYHTIIRIAQEEFTSAPQEMLPAGTINDVTYSFREDAINPGKLNLPQDAAYFNMNSEGVAGYPNLFRWRWSGIYQVKTFPELKTKFAGRPPAEVADPVPCSGYIAGGPNGIRQVDICTCCDCWIPEVGENALVSNNAFVENNEFKNVFIARLAIDKWRFSLRYYMKIEQLSVSEEVYDFWKLIKSQQDGEGSLFQPNSVKVRGNIRSVTNPDKEVFGVFGVSAVVSKDVFIERTQIPIIFPTEEVRGSCVGLIEGSSNKRPLFW